MTITVTAFKLRNEPTFYDAVSGAQLPDTYEGCCQVCFADGPPMVFRTGLTSGERYWSAVGNNPKFPVVFASYNLL